ncbi:hypothetical protein R5R35_012523 [Gryllus longicercus]|uniref:Uncharacterized protein n=1 Tax=Gryllus longicercus TaxID=2509291 RepID=A0AAN9Z135_9ORTH
MRKFLSQFLLCASAKRTAKETRSWRPGRALFFSLPLSRSQHPLESGSIPLPPPRSMRRHPPRGRYSRDARRARRPAPPFPSRGPFGSSASAHATPTTTAAAFIHSVFCE